MEFTKFFKDTITCHLLSKSKNKRDLLTKKLEKEQNDFNKTIEELENNILQEFKIILEKQLLTFLKENKKGIYLKLDSCFPSEYSYLKYCILSLRGRLNQDLVLYLDSENLVTTRRELKKLDDSVTENVNNIVTSLEKSLDEVNFD